MPIKSWKGPLDWSGLAVEGWRKFPFHLLPWMTLSTKNQSAGNVHCIKDSDSRRVYRINPSDSDLAENIRLVQEAYAKRYLVNSLRRRVGRFLAGSRAEREFNLGLKMLKAGLPTPAPLACAENLKHSAIKRFGVDVILPPASYLLTRSWTNDGSVRFYVFKHRETAEAMGIILARFLAHLHARGFYHDDCSTEHFLVAPSVNVQQVISWTEDAWEYGVEDSPLAVIDIDNGSLESKPIENRRRIMNLFQIVRSTGPAFSGRARKVFLEEYMKRSGLDCDYDTKAMREEIEKIAKRKVGKKVFKK